MGTKGLQFEFWCFEIDYAVQIFHDALTTGHHTCYLKPDTRLPMMYIDDCLNSLHQMMSAPKVFLILKIMYLGPNYLMD